MFGSPSPRSLFDFTVIQDEGEIQILQIRQILQSKSQLKNLNITNEIQNKNDNIIFDILISFEFFILAFYLL